MPLMRRDAYGLPVSTGTAAALEAYDRAVEGLLSWDGRALDLFRTANAHDPGLALGHAGAANLRAPGPSAAGADAAGGRVMRKSWRADIAGLITCKRCRRSRRNWHHPNLVC